jgi:predicted nucleic acid-binding protein
MVLADTSVWVEHFRRGEPKLAGHLVAGLVLMHPFVLGELACGNLKRRDEILADLQELPLAKLASTAEALRLIEDRRLWGRGLGWVDVHLLASALLSDCAFWTLDKRLAHAAAELELKARKNDGHG